MAEDESGVTEGVAVGSTPGWKAALDALKPQLEAVRKAQETAANNPALTAAALTTAMRDAELVALTTLMEEQGEPCVIYGHEASDGETTELLLRDPKKTGIPDIEASMGSKNAATGVLEMRISQLKPGASTREFGSAFYVSDYVGEPTCIAVLGETSFFGEDGPSSSPDDAGYKLSHMIKGDASFPGLTPEVVDAGISRFIDIAASSLPQPPAPPTGGGIRPA